MAEISALMQRWSPWPEVVLGLLALILLVAIVIVLARARRPLPGAKAEPPKPNNNELVHQSLRRSFRAARETLRDLYGGRDFRYASPLVAVVGAPDSGKSSFIAGSGLTPVTAGADGPAAFSFFADGALLDLRGDLLGLDRPAGLYRPWEEVLSQLDMLKPERPLDGIVLTISVADLSGPTKLRPEALAERGEVFNRRLGRMQRQLGMQLPIYIVLTQADLLDGFTELVQLTRTADPEEILGWSSPYSSDAAFTPDWVAEGIAQLQTNAREAAIAGLATVPNAERYGPAVLLPGGIGELAEPLGILLATTLRQSTFNELSMLRGIYMVGGSGSSAAESGQAPARLPATIEAEGPATGRGRRPAIAFARDLIAEKILAERAVAQPQTRGLLVRRRRLLIAQAAVGALIIAALFGFVYVERTVSQRSFEVHRLLLAIDEQIERENRPGEQRAAMRASSVDLIQQLNFVPNDVLSLWVLPSSWATTATRNIAGLKIDVVRGLLFRNLHDQLTAKLAALPADARRQVVAVSGGTTNGDTLITNYLAQINGYEQLINLYTSLGTLPGQRNANTPPVRTALHEIVSRVDGTNLPDRFLDIGAQAIREYPSQLPPINVDLYRNGAREGLNAIFRAYVAQLSEHNKLEYLVPQLITTLDESVDVGTAGYVDLVRLPRMQGLLDQIDEIIRAGSYDWVLRDDLDRDTEWRGWLETIRASTLLGPDLADQIEAQGLSARSDFMDTVVGARSITMGPIFTTTNDTLSLSPQLQALRQTVAAVPTTQGNDNAGQPLLTQMRPLPRGVGPGSYVQWDAGWLGRAVAEIANYQGALGATAAGRSNVGIKDLVERDLDQRLAVYLGRAIVVRPVPAGANGLDEEVFLQQRVDNFVSVVPTLNSILLTLRQIGSNQNRATVARLAAGEAYSILDAARRLVDTARPYQPRGGDFSWWDGSAKAAYGAFGVATDADLKLYLKYQRERIAHWARDFAKPALDFLMQQSVAGEPVGLDALNFWRQILDQLQSFDQQDQSSSVLQLETWISGPLNAATIDDCGSLGLSNMPAQPGGFFLSRLADLSRAAQSRCDVLAMQRIDKNYGDLANYFNSRLAGSYPFATNQNRQAAIPAIFQFLDRFDAFMNAGNGDPARWTDQSPAAQAALKFLTQMDAVDAFFRESRVSIGRQPSIAMSVTASFRVNRSKERAADEVAMWSIKIGDTTLTQYDPEKAITWTPGQPISVGFRWAIDAPTRPRVRTGSPPNLSTDNGEARYSYTGPWSIFGLVADHAAPPSEVPIEETQEGTRLLMFDVPLVDSDENAKTARLFIRLTFRGPNELGAPLLDFPDFPVVAPPARSQPAPGAQPAAAPGRPVRPRMGANLQ